MSDKLSPKSNSLTGILTRQGYLIKKNECPEAVSKKFIHDLTAKPIIMKAYMRVGQTVDDTAFPIYFESPNYYFLPRFWALQNPEIQTLFPYVENRLKAGVAMNSKVSFIFPLLPHQHKGYNAATKSLNELGGGVLSLPCGYGKTALAIKLAIDQGGKTLVIVNKECLMDQWVQAVTKFTGGVARIGIIQQSKVDTTDKDFVIGMIHSISQKDYPEGTFDDFHMTIIDECHHLGSRMFSQALAKVSSMIMLGLSATPNRKDGLSFVFHAYLGPLCHSEKRSGSNKIMIKRVFLNSSSDEYRTVVNASGTKNTSLMLTNISKHTQRNIMIIDSIRLLMKEPRKILVLSGRREQLSELYAMLETANITTIHGRALTFGYYVGNKGGKKAIHKAMLEKTAKCDVILGTHNIAAEGLDIPDLNTEILATPLADVEQAIGRILRKFHNIPPVVLDIVDHCGNFTNQGRARLKLYHSEGYSEYDFSMNIDKFKIDDVDFSKHILEKPDLTRTVPAGEISVESECYDDDPYDLDDNSLLLSTRGNIRVEIPRDTCLIP